MNWFSKYVTYLQDNSEGYWFKRKLFGWGWTPATWQGWAVTAVALIAILYIVQRATHLPDTLMWRQGVAPVCLIALALIVISYLTGEPPRWQWGWPKKEDASLRDRIDQMN